jgi:hypothetical protein
MAAREFAAAFASMVFLGAGRFWAFWLGALPHPLSGMKNP